MKRLLFYRKTPSGLVLTPAAAVTSGALALSLFCAVAFFVFASLEYTWNWAGVWRYREKFLDGWLMTIALAAAALALSVAIGALAALASRSRFIPLRYATRAYVELARGTPLLVQILIFFYIVADAFHLENRYVVGTVILAFFSGAYLAEIFRAGIESVGKSQLQSARAIGLTERQTFRFVVLPQALRHSLPAMTGQLANLIKDSSLLSIIAISEFTLNAREIDAITSSSFESYFPLAIGYLALTLPIMSLSRYAERRLRFDT